MKKTMKISRVSGEELPARRPPCGSAPYRRRLLRRSKGSLVDQIIHTDAMVVELNQIAARMRKSIEKLEGSY